MIFIFIIQIDVKIDDSTSRIDDILLQAAESLDSYASQFIKDTVKKMVCICIYIYRIYFYLANIIYFVSFSLLKNEEIHCLEKYVAEKEHLLNASTKKIVQLDDSLLQIKEELKNLRIIYEQNESQRLNLKKER